VQHVQQFLADKIQIDSSSLYNIIATQPNKILTQDISVVERLGLNSGSTLNTWLDQPSNRAKLSSDTDLLNNLKQYVCQQFLQHTTYAQKDELAGVYQKLLQSQEAVYYVGRIPADSAVIEDGNNPSLRANFSELKQALQLVVLPVLNAAPIESSNSEPLPNNCTFTKAAEQIKQKLDRYTHNKDEAKAIGLDAGCIGKWLSCCKIINNNQQSVLAKITALNNFFAHAIALADFTYDQRRQLFAVPYAIGQIMNKLLTNLISIAQQADVTDQHKLVRFIPESQRKFQNVAEFIRGATSAELQQFIERAQLMEQQSSNSASINHFITQLQQLQGMMSSKDDPLSVVYPTQVVDCLTLARRLETQYALDLTNRSNHTELTQQENNIKNLQVSDLVQLCLDMPSVHHTMQSISKKVMQDKNTLAGMQLDEGCRYLFLTADRQWQQADQALHYNLQGLQLFFNSVGLIDNTYNTRKQLFAEQHLNLLRITNLWDKLNPLAQDIDNDTNVKQSLLYILNLALPKDKEVKTVQEFITKATQEELQHAVNSLANIEIDNDKVQPFIAGLQAICAKVARPNRDSLAVLAQNSIADSSNRLFAQVGDQSCANIYILQQLVEQMLSTSNKSALSNTEREIIHQNADGITNSLNELLTQLRTANQKPYQYVSAYVDKLNNFFSVPLQPDINQAKLNYFATEYSKIQLLKEKKDGLVSLADKLFSKNNLIYLSQSNAVLNGKNIKNFMQDASGQQLETFISKLQADVRVMPESVSADMVTSINSFIEQLQFLLRSLPINEQQQIGVWSPIRTGPLLLTSSQIINFIKSARVEIIQNTTDSAYCETMLEQLQQCHVELLTTLQDSSLGINYVSQQHTASDLLAQLDKHNNNPNSTKAKELIAKLLRLHDIIQPWLDASIKQSQPNHYLSLLAKISDSCQAENKDSYVKIRELAASLSDKEIKQLIAGKSNIQFVLKDYNGDLGAFVKQASADEFTQLIAAVRQDKGSSEIARNLVERPLNWARRRLKKPTDNSQHMQISNLQNLEQYLTAISTAPSLANLTAAYLDFMWAHDKSLFSRMASLVKSNTLLANSSANDLSSGLAFIMADKVSSAYRAFDQLLNKIPQSLKIDRESLAKLSAQEMQDFLQQQSDDLEAKLFIQQMTAILDELPKAIFSSTTNNVCHPSQNSTIKKLANFTLVKEKLQQLQDNTTAPWKTRYNNFFQQLLSGFILIDPSVTDKLWQYYTQVDSQFKKLESLAVKNNLASDAKVQELFNSWGYANIPDFFAKSSTQEWLQLQDILTAQGEGYKEFLIQLNVIMSMLVLEKEKNDYTTVTTGTQDFAQHIDKLQKYVQTVIKRIADNAQQQPAEIDQILELCIKCQDLIRRTGDIIIPNSKTLGQYSGSLTSFISQATLQQWQDLAQEINIKSLSEANLSPAQSSFFQDFCQFATNINEKSSGFSKTDLNAMAHWSLLAYCQSEQQCRTNQKVTTNQLSETLAQIKTTQQDNTIANQSLAQRITTLHDIKHDVMNVNCQYFVDWHKELQQLREYVSLNNIDLMQKLEGNAKAQAFLDMYNNDLLQFIDKAPSWQLVSFASIINSSGLNVILESLASKSPDPLRELSQKINTIVAKAPEFKKTFSSLGEDKVQTLTYIGNYFIQLPDQDSLQISNYCNECKNMKSINAIAQHLKPARYTLGWMKRRYAELPLKSKLLIAGIVFGVGVGVCAGTFGLAALPLLVTAGIALAPIFLIKKRQPSHPTTQNSIPNVTKLANKGLNINLGHVVKLAQRVNNPRNPETFDDATINLPIVSPRKESKQSNTSKKLGLGSG
jgi:hypothetical protein